MISWWTLSCCNWEWVQVFRPIKYSKKYISWWLVFFLWSNEMNWVLEFFAILYSSLKKTSITSNSSQTSLGQQPKKGLLINSENGFWALSKDSTYQPPSFTTTYETWVDVASVVQFYDLVDNLRFWVFLEIVEEPASFIKDSAKNWLVVWVDSS